MRSWLYPRSFRSWLWAVVRIYIAVLVILFCFQEHLLFEPTASTQEQTYKFATPSQERFLDFEGAKIHSLLFQPANSKGLILFFHGNAGNLERWSVLANDLAEQLQWSVWAVDYPGFGKSGGKIYSEEQLHNLANLLYDTAKQGFPAQKIVVFGLSMGTGISLKLANDRKVSGVVLDAAYLSMIAMQKLEYPWVPSFLLRYPLRSDEWIQNIDVPVLQFHGTEDGLIPFAQGQQLSKLGHNVKFVAIEHGHHSNLDSSPLFWQSMKSFLAPLEQNL